MAKQNRTEKATPRRRQKAEEHGQIPKSREVSSTAVFLGFILFLSFLWPSMLRDAKEIFKELLLMGSLQEMTVYTIRGFVFKCATGVIKLTAPILSLTLVVGVVSQLAQVGFKFSADRFKLHFDRFNPVTNVGRLFSKTGLVEFAKSTLVFGVIGYISYTIMREEIASLPGLVLVPINQVLMKFNLIIYRIAVRVGVFLGILALADYLFQRYQYEQNLKMTKQEVKEEMKSLEGDPLIKGRIKKMQFNLMRRRMMAAVPKADVVITNPTHYAVALVYKFDSMEAPQVVAKGQHYLARKIREIAMANQVPIVENPPVARALYKSVEVGQTIPYSLYKAVAEILAFVYKAKESSVP